MNMPKTSKIQGNMMNDDVISETETAEDIPKGGNELRMEQVMIAKVFKDEPDSD
ncbi:hypothetical protein H2248_005682 [Termitomyces sp. 'cryptogamus']|nr:hypothetical protein H2248_005682 [Termitomyces sp. 'cryptogamus']